MNWRLKRMVCRTVWGKDNCPHIPGIGESWLELLTDAFIAICLGSRKGKDS